MSKYIRVPLTEVMEKIAYGQYDSMLDAADEVIERIGMIVNN